MMVWLIVSVVVVCGAFSGTYIYTGDIWSAMFAGGIPTLVYMAGLAIRASRPPAGRGRRIAVLAVSILVLTGISAQFAVMCSRTRWQSNELVVIRKSLDRTMLMSTLFDHASPAFVAYQQQRVHGRHTVADFFKAACDTCDWSVPLTVIETLPESLKVYASAGPTGSVELIGVSVLMKGFDPNFRNVNGSTGFIQSHLYLTPEGMAYADEN
jgi:hypothetical protein